VTRAPNLGKLSVTEKDALILALVEQLTTAHQRIAEQDKIIAAQAERIAALEAKLAPKTPDNSSMPPSKGQKKDRAEPGHDRPRRKS
jgi:transposase